MTDREQTLNAAYVDEAFEYREGVLYWKERPVHHFKDEWRQRIFNSRQAGTEAGTLMHGYVQVRFSFGKVAAHRIIFLMHHGYLPKEIDHIDGNPSNNRIENLRSATHAENLRNGKVRCNSASGITGVSFHKRTGKWAAGIRVDGKWKYLGVFPDKSLAAEVRREAEVKHFGEFVRGR